MLSNANKAAQRAAGLLAIIAAFTELAQADVYMHNPRGSNDRNCERNVNRDNGNRVFDSQNNNKGGYACPRGVGDETFQNEEGDATFSQTDDDGDTVQFTQSKRVYYYEGSILPIEWTNQHGCGGNSKVSCEMVLQYACEDTLDPRVDDFWPWTAGKGDESTAFHGMQHFRSGEHVAAPRDGIPRDDQDAATDTIPDNEASAISDTVETRRFGMHESYDFYQVCQHTERNRGLYTADQQVRRNDQRGTRQNPNGNRRGLECPEERDYYPWWAPSPWIDIAVLTDSAVDEEVCRLSTYATCSQRCKYYIDNTMNFNTKGYCDVNHETQTAAEKTNSARWANTRNWYNNRDACEAAGFVWYEVSHDMNINIDPDEFVCAATQYSRVNQLGNARGDSVISENEAADTGIVADQVNQGVNANRFLWTVPTIPTPVGEEADYFNRGMEAAYKHCTLRMRYNISSADFQQWPMEANDVGAERMVDYKNNSRSSDDPNTPLQQDPYVYIGPGDSETKGDMFVKLKVNTNQYGRTFQDRSYSFSIKPLPAESSSASNKLDTPDVDVDGMTAALANGGKIYNVNVRGKRGNIVQTYPAVEYDFVPNALALGSNDMIHFQWTGSDYNPRRGCNDAAGGPPDLNTYSTDANANQNPRADRSNIVFTNYMAENVPKDYLGYDPSSTTLEFSDKTAASMATLLADAPCYDPDAKFDSNAERSAVMQQCYEMVMRLAYLNQQSDVGSLILRGGNKCLTADELDAISNQDVADFHPLNCAKINAKPYPYYDGGVMMMRKSGKFPFYSSRNNNFSNRQQIGLVCVGDDCAVDPDTNVLQDENPQTNGASIIRITRNAASRCYDTAGGEDGANANAAMSCISSTGKLLSVETQAVQEGDNDGYGDGRAKGCAVADFSLNSDGSSSNSGSSSKKSSGDSNELTDEEIGLIIAFLFIGLFLSWLAYYLYNRWQARKDGDSKFRYETSWLSAAAPDGSGKRSRPNSGRFWGENPTYRPASTSPPPGELPSPVPLRNAAAAPSPSAPSSDATVARKSGRRIEMI